MQQQPIKQQHDLTQINNTPTFAELAKNQLMHRYGMTAQEGAIYDAEISIGLLKLRTAFPTQTRNYSDREHDMLMALWLEIFVAIEPGIFHEAIMRFVAADRKGFFPSLGQIMGIIEDIQTERERQATEERIKTHAAYLRQTQQRIDSGENCSTCKFCDHRDTPQKPGSAKTEVQLYCQNPDSFKYEGQYGHGTVATILCEHYEKKLAD
ncbi:MAG: replicative helicase loader/inhibitor [Defluviitaleaceae bacterium]|nr:replicative helicase loader/inhibitor [Defluviitaleaceae bacterium]